IFSPIHQISLRTNATLASSGHLHASSDNRKPIALWVSTKRSLRRTTRARALRYALEPVRDARSRDMTCGPGAKRAKPASHGERVRYHGRAETRITLRRAYCITF